MRRNPGIIGIALCMTLAWALPAPAQPPLPPQLPRFLCPTPGKPCPKPPPDVRPQPASCKGNPALTGRCYWVRGAYDIKFDLSVFSLLHVADSKQILWISPAPDARPHAQSGRPFPASVAAALGPNGENVSGLYEVCPIAIEDPHVRGKIPAICINAARDLKTVPLDDDFYRRNPQARARWDAFQKKAHNGAPP